MIKVLVVDDSALVRKLFGKVLADDPEFEVFLARDGADALRQLHTVKPDVITLDVHMPDMNGLQCLDRIMIEKPSPVVMVSSMTAEGAETTLEALRLGAVDFVPKPDGAVSLAIDTFAPQFVAKIRSAAKARLKSSSRLRERIQHRNVASKAGARPAARHRPSEIRRIASGLVLVGTSTGGPPALEVVLGALPGSFPWPVVVAQHMPASFTGPLARRLNQKCELTVTEVIRPTLVSPGNVYIARGDGDIVVLRTANAASVMPVPASDSLWHPSTDRLVRSAMDCIPPEQLVGILMTGMGYDGAEAMNRLHALGGCTIAEAEETAVVWGMPGELAKSGGADWVLPLPEIAQKLQQAVLTDATRS